ncbi:MAG: hypothetical protein KatS3mg114_0729 [Planctomycetaceae bacterium]|nr:MAG: hypothetical protein KatS3mg114_0729 [Planctomycetaceae bacterium]
MPELLMVVLDRQHVTVGQAEVEGHHARWKGGWRAAWPDGQNYHQNPKAAGEWLKSQWSQARLTARSAWVFLSRDDILLRPLELPLAPDEELPDLVRFQAASKMAVSLDQFQHDFLPLPMHTARPYRDVLVALCPITLLDGLRLMMKTADRELLGVGFHSTAIAEWVLREARRRDVESSRHDPARSGAQALVASLTRRGQDLSHAHVVVVLKDAHVDVVLVAERQMLYAHSATAPSPEPEVIRRFVKAEVNRTLLTASRMRPQMTWHQGWLVLGTEELASDLQSVLGCPVERVQHTQVPEWGHGALPATVNQAAVETMILEGALVSRTHDAAPTIDFLHPRQPPPKRDPRRQKMIVAAAAVLSGLFLILGTSIIVLNVMDRRLEALRQELAQLNREVQAGQRDLQVATLLREWEARNITQPELLRRLEEMLPGEYQRPYLSDYQFTPGGSDALAAIALAGAARTRQHVEEFQRRLRDENFRVRPSPFTTTRDEQYPSGFNFSADLLPSRPNPPTSSRPR